MRFEDLAARLVAVEAKLATLTGTSVNTDNATSIEELDARLSIVEIQVDQLISAKIQSQVEAIVAAPADDAPVAVEAVVALSASVDVPAAADIVADVVTAQVEALSVEHTEVANIVAAAVMAVVEANPEVVVDTAAITEAIMTAVAEMPAPAPEVAAEAAAAVAEIIAAATGEEVAPEVQQQVAEAVAAPADPALDNIEHRLNVAEAKVDSLLGK
jgi:ribonuclease E